MATNHNFRVKNGLEVAGTEIVNSSGVIQLASTLTSSTQSAGTNNTTLATTAFVTAAVAAIGDGHIDWTGSSAGTIHSSNYTNTTYSVGDGGLTTNDFTNADHSKLNAIEANATADQTDAEIRAAVEAATDSNVFTDADHTKLNAVEASADVTDTANVVAALTAGTNVTISAGGTIASTDTNTTYSVGDGGLTTNDFTNADHSKLNAIEASADVTDTANVVAALSAGTGVAISGGGTISVTAVALTTVQTAANQTAHLALTAQEGDIVVRSDENKTYCHNGGSAGTMNDYTLLATPTDAVLSVAGNTGAVSAAQIAAAVEAASNSNTFTDADHSKLNAIEANATADQTDAEIRTAVEAASDSNVFTDADHSKLNAIEASATADQTGAQIKALYEAESNAYTDTKNSKLAGIEASATADQSNAEIRAAVEAATDSNVFTDADHTKLNAIEASADVTDTTNVVAALTAGTNVTIAADGTIASTDTNTTYSVGDGGLTTNDFTNADHSKLNAIEASADVTDTTNVVAALTAGTNVTIAADGTIASTDTNTTYSVGDGGLTTNDFTNADHSKLNAIEASATADQTDAEIRAAIEAATDSNAFTDADHSKLNAIEASATADQTGAEIKALYEAESNAYTDALNTKLSGIETSATADQTDAEIRAAVEAATNSNVFTDADHSKLNAIEASATADQTDAEIRAAVEAASDSNVFTDADHSKLNAIEASADVTDTANVVAALSAGTGVAISGGGAISVTAVALTTVQTASSQIAHLALTAQEGDIVVRSDENKTYCHNGGSAGNMTDYTLLATPTDAVLSVNGNTGAVSAAQIAAAVEAASNSNTFTDADHSKLGAIEASATADQTDAEIRTAVEAASDSNVFTDADHSKLNAIEANADVTDTTNVVAALTAGTNVAIAANGTISSTNTTYSVGDGGLTTNDFTNADHSKLNAIEASATADQTDAEIRAAVEAATDSNVFTDADHSKLNAIEASATADQTDAEIRTAVEAASNSNVFTDADHSKLNAIEASATADQTDAEIRTAVEAATDSNVFTDADHSKLNAIEANADVTDTTNVTSAGALMDSELTSIASVKALNQGVATGNSPTFAALTITGAITSAAKAVGTQTVTATAPTSATGFPNGHVWYVV